MRFLSMLEFIFGLFTIVFALTQIIIPLITRGKLFWILRRSPERAIENVYNELSQEDKISELEKLVENLKEKRNKKSLRDEIYSKPIEPKENNSFIKKPAKKKSTEIYSIPIEPKENNSFIKKPAKKKSTNVVGKIPGCPIGGKSPISSKS